LFVCVATILSALVFLVGPAAASNAEIEAKKPKAPSDFAAVAISANAVYLTWKDNADNEAAFFIYRGVKPGDADTFLDSVHENVTEFTDTEAKPDITYYYRIKATNNYGGSGYTEEVSATTSPPFAKVITLRINSPNMFINGVSQQIDPGRNTSPVVVNGRTLVPIRAIVEALGGEIVWEASEQKTTVKMQDNSIDLWSGKTTAKVNGVETAIDAAPSIINGRTMLPLRFISESLGSRVLWDGNDKRVTIISQ
jgi:hypothetical protein